MIHEYGGRQGTWHQAAPATGYADNA